MAPSDSSERRETSAPTATWRSSSWLRIRREGIRGAQLEHENLAEILSYEDNENGECFLRAGVKNPFIVMEFVRGQTLESLIRKLGDRWPGEVQITEQTLSIAARVAAALTFLHRKKIVHRPGP